MPTYSTTNLGPYFSQSGSGQQPQGGGAGRDAFLVNVNDLGPALSNLSETNLQMGGGYVGAPTNVMSPDSGYGGAGIQSINPPNLSIWDQITNWISQNPIPSIGIGIFGLMLFKGGGRR